jgi:hypothetical protein
MSDFLDDDFCNHEVDFMFAASDIPDGKYRWLAAGAALGGNLGWSYVISSFAAVESCPMS